VAARKRLYENCNRHGYDAESIVLAAIERQMDKYFQKFNLIGLNSLL